MLFYNINFNNGLYNGIRLIVLSITLRLLKCSILRSQRYSAIMQLLHMPLHTLSSINGIKFTCY